MLQASVANTLQIEAGSHSADADRMAFLDELMKSKNYAEGRLTDILIITQKLFGFLPENVLLHIAEKMKIPSSHVWAVATFYDMFKFELEIEGSSSCLEAKDGQS